METLLVIDNYDSFTYNLVQMFKSYALSIKVLRSDQLAVKDVAGIDPDYILISPGPKDPLHAGISIQLIQAYYNRVPILGVCLGMQCINEAFGGHTVRTPVPMHGKTSLIRHAQDALFQGLTSPFRAARYHSLAAALSAPSITDTLKVTAHADDGVIMGLSHRQYPLHGVQFHPESFLTENGAQLVENFLKTGPIASRLG